jgi:trigger factor
MSNEAENEPHAARNPSLTSSITETGPVTRVLKVEVPAGRLAQSMDATFSQLAGRAKLPGFRRGKVPRKVLEREYGTDVREQVISDLTESACRDAIAEHRLTPVANPRLLNRKVNEAGALEFEVRVEIRPEFKLKPYRALDLVHRVIRVEDRHVDASLESLRERMAELIPEEDRVNVAQGDVVLVDMYAFVDGKPLDSASGKGVVIEVGRGRFPDDLERQLVGVTRGIPTPIDVRFSPEHRDSAIAGKLVRFQVTVREIKNKILPAVDDEFARTVDVDGCNTVADLRDRIRQDLERRAQSDGERRARSELLELLVAAYSFEVPESLLDRRIAEMAHDLGVREVTEQQIEELRKAFRPEAAKQVRVGFVLDSIAAAEQLEVSEEDLRSEVNRMAASAGANAEQVREHYAPASRARESLRIGMLRDKAVDRVVELASRREVMIDASQVADRQGSG